MVIFHWLHVRLLSTHQTVLELYADRAEIKKTGMAAKHKTSIPVFFVVFPMFTKGYVLFCFFIIVVRKASVLLQ